jgi:hypothetical protein
MNWRGKMIQRPAERRYGFSTSRWDAGALRNPPIRLSMIRFVFCLGE